MSVSIDDVRYIARLARLSFSEEEETRLVGQMSEILDYMAKLNELDTTGVPPLAHVLDVGALTRDDEVAPRISHDQALAAAPDADARYFRVPKVL